MRHFPVGWTATQTLACEFSAPHAKTGSQAARRFGIEYCLATKQFVIVHLPVFRDYNKDLKVIGKNG